MPMSDQINAVDIKPLSGGQSIQEQYAEPLVPVAEQRRLIDFEKLKAQTGSGELEEYKNHPLNWNQSKPVARIIRGFTGLLGELNFAVVDILIGFFELNSKKRKLVENGTDIQRSANLS